MAWILEKYNAINKKNYTVCYVDFCVGRLALRLESATCVFGLVEKAPSKAEAILAAIKFLGLGKKDNIPMGLNKRLLEVGFRKGDCSWVCSFNRVRSAFVGDTELPVAINQGVALCPNGAHPSTIGVATAWLRSFPKIGESLHFWKNSQTGTWNIGGQTLYPTHDGFSSELEALVEFAEWAQKEGLMS